MIHVVQRLDCGCVLTITDQGTSTDRSQCTMRPAVELASLLCFNFGRPVAAVPAALGKEARCAESSTGRPSTLVPQ